MPSRSNSLVIAGLYSVSIHSMRRVRGLVVLGVGVGREEVVRQAELVRVDVEHRRVLAERLELAVGLGLRPGEPVAVHVEAVQVAAGLLLAAVRVLDGQDHDERVGQDAVDHAVAARGELVEGVAGPRRRRSPRCRGRWPDSHRIAGVALVAAVTAAVRRGRVSEHLEVRPDGREAGCRHPGRGPDHRVADGPATDRGGRERRRDAVAGRVHGPQIRVALGGADLLGPEREAEGLLGRRDGRDLDLGRGRERITGRGGKDRGGREDPAQTAGRYRQRTRRVVGARDSSKRWA